MHGSLALGQALGLLAPVADLSQAQRQDLFGHGQTGLGMPYGRCTGQYLEALLALIVQSLPAITLLDQALRDTLLQSFQALRLPLLLAMCTYQTTSATTALSTKSTQRAESSAPGSLLTPSRTKGQRAWLHSLPNRNRELVGRCLRQKSIGRW